MDAVLPTIDLITDCIRGHLPELRRRYGVTAIGVFGSYVRGEARQRSDIDILVDFDEAISLFRFIELELELRKVLGRKVGLLLRSALKPGIGKSILGEVEYLG